MPIPQTITVNGGAGPDEESNLLGDNITDNNNDNRGGPARSPTIKPMDHLVSSRRRNICWSVSLLIFFLGLIGSLAVWRFQHSEDASVLSTVAGRVQHAQIVLNKHFKTQSRTMATGCEATVMILRHCEKSGPNIYDDEGNQHCSYLGMERAEYLKSLFGAQGDDSSTTTSPRWPVPSFLFALTPDRGSHWNYREYETLRPLAKKIGQDVNIVNPVDLPPRLFDLLHSGELCGRLVVVSFKHEYIPDLATALACGPEQGCPSQYPSNSFDQVWQLKYVFRPSLDFERNNDETNLMNNDDGDDDDNNRRHRHTRGSKKHRKRNDGWFVYASVVNQHFDPLSFSGQVGDYKPEGVPNGGRWKDDEI